MTDRSKNKLFRKSPDITLGDFLFVSVMLRYFSCKCGKIARGGPHLYEMNPRARVIENYVNTIF